MISDPGYRLVNATLRAANAMLRESTRFFRPLGLTEAQINVLNVLAQSEPGEGLSQRELSDWLVVDRSNVTGLLDRLEKTGWVQRTDDPVDRRVYRVSLTPSGRRLHAKVLPLFLKAVSQVTAGFSAVEMERATGTLSSLEKAAKTWGCTIKVKGEK